MINTLARTTIAFALLAVTASGAGFNWAQLEQLQKSPVAFGIRADGGYGLQSKKIDYGASAELLFPLISTARLRAQVLSLTIFDGNHNTLTFNNELGFDALVAWPMRRYRIFPYAYVGAGFTAVDNVVSYVARGGLGVEGTVARIGKAFAEVGVSQSHIFADVTQVRAGIGARFGR